MKIRVVRRGTMFAFFTADKAVCELRVDVKNVKTGDEQSRIMDELLRRIRG